MVRVRERRVARPNDAAWCSFFANRGQFAHGTAAEDAIDHAPVAAEDAANPPPAEHCQFPGVEPCGAVALGEDLSEPAHELFVLNDREVDRSLPPLERDLRELHGVPSSAAEETVR